MTKLARQQKKAEKRAQKKQKPAETVAVIRPAKVAKAQTTELATMTWNALPATSRRTIKEGSKPNRYEAKINGQWKQVELV